MSQLARLLRPVKPRFCGIQDGDHMWEALREDVWEDNGVKTTYLLCRDWRQSQESRHCEEVAAPHLTGPYTERRFANAASNKVSRRLDELKGSCKGRPAYVMLSGPSLIRNLLESPPPPGAVVIAVNRAFVFSPYPIDFFLCSDAVVDRPRLNDWDASWKPPEGFPNRPSLNDKLSTSNLLAMQWTDAKLVDRFREGTDRAVFFRKSGLAKDNLIGGIDMTLPGLEVCYFSGTHTLNLADYLGCSRIEIVGGDFAFTGDEFHPGDKRPESIKGSPYFYTKGIEYFGERAGKPIDEAVSDTPTEKLTLTDTHFYVAASKMETWAWLLRRYGVPCVNLTGAGLLNRWFQHRRDFPEDWRIAA